MARKASPRKKTAGFVEETRAVQAEIARRLSVGGSGGVRIGGLDDAYNNINIGPVWGWHYLYGKDPAAEARIAAERISQLGLEGYLLDIEGEFKQPERAAAAQAFFETLRSAVSAPLGLASFRYPSFHRDMPWPALLAGVEFVTPMVFWEQAHNPAAQLRRSFDEYARLTPARPFFPLGAAYAAGDWQPTATDLAEFIQTACDLGLNGASLFNWDWIGRAENGELWDVLSQHRWEALTPTPPTQPTAPLAEPEPEPEPAPPPRPETRLPVPSFERRLIQIVRNDEVEGVEDRLGFEGYADAFAALVHDDRTRPPLTIGISGAWGSGKSFLLHRIYTKLRAAAGEAAPAPEGKRDVHVVRFNAWDYNASEAVWPALVRSILERLEGEAGPFERSISRARRNLTIIDMPMAQWITNLFAQGRGYGSALGYMDEIRDDIVELKKRLPAGAKVVVIIDDLDRCSADKIVETLEALKLLLNFDIFIVFLAVDSSVIARAVELRYKDVLAESGRSGYFYLDKIIQIPFRLPEPDPDKVTDYLFSLLSAADRPPAGALPAEKAQQLADRLIPPAPPRFGARPTLSVRQASDLRRMIAALPDDPADVDTIAAEVGGYLARNRLPASDVGLAWALLARWWPVSAYLMHEALRNGPASLDAPGEAGGALARLADAADAGSAADIRTRRLREVADAPLSRFRPAVEAAPALSQSELEAVLVKWQMPYAITIGFSPAELEAFQTLSPYLLKNPRHIKRLVNTYSLIRMLAARSPSGERVST